MLSVVLVLKGSEVRYPILCIIISSEKSIQFFRVLQFSLFAQIFSMLFVDAMLDRNNLSLVLINVTVPLNYLSFTVRPNIINKERRHVWRN